MNIETANRLYELRKKNNLSQEELADKLGISRQAVSKWERAEASPDTDNLILLAKLYGVTLDELLNSDNAQEAAEENKSNQEFEEAAEAKEEKSDSIHIGKGGIHITSKDGKRVDIAGDGVYVTDKDGNVVRKDIHKKDPVGEILSGVTVFAALIAYLILGFTTERGWVSYWVLFLSIPLVSTFWDAIRKKRMTNFAYPVLVTAVYCFLGMRFFDLTYTFAGTTFVGFWHPWWFLFLTIPVYYIIAKPIDCYVFKSIEQDEDDDDDEDGEVVSEQ